MSEPLNYHNKHFPMSSKLGELLEQYRFTEMHEYDDDYAELALAAYKPTSDCINAEYWEVERLEQEICDKLRYAYLAVLLHMYGTEREFQIVVEPSYESYSTVVVIEKVNNIPQLVCISDDKAWNFECDENTLGSLEDFLGRLKIFMEVVT